MIVNVSGDSPTRFFCGEVVVGPSSAARLWLGRGGGLLTRALVSLTPKQDIAFIVRPRTAPPRGGGTMTLERGSGDPRHAPCQRALALSPSQAFGFLVGGRLFGGYYQDDEAGEEEQEVEELGAHVFFVEHYDAVEEGDDDAAAAYH